MKKVSISHLRRIDNLDFELPDGRGVYLLTGANGAGKSTLLSALAQIGDRGALDHFFRPNIMFRDSGGDNIFSESAIRYDPGDGCAVEYRFVSGAWRAHPADAEKNVLAAFGFAETVFTGAKPKRQLVDGELFDKAAIRPAADGIRTAAAEIFDDEAFRQLYRIKSPATGEDLFLRAQEVNGKTYYFSDNNFSAGERAILKLAEIIGRVPRNSFLLIDEAEMALHPKAQKRLIVYLDRMAKLKNLLILVSTQSASLIKITDPKKILFLEDDEAAGKMVCRRNVYPAAILGEMAFAEEILPETILLVEDSEAAMLLEAIVARLKQVVRSDFPYTKILPVGGYMQVVILMDNLAKVFPPFVHRRAVLDRDAERNIRLTAEQTHRAHHDVVSRNIERIYFLPCAPEQGVVRLLEGNPKLHSENLGHLFSAPGIRLADVMRGNASYCAAGGDSRSECKEKLAILANYLAAASGEPEGLVRRKLYGYYVDKHYYRNAERLKSEYCPLIFRRG